MTFEGGGELGQVVKPSPPLRLILDALSIDEPSGVALSTTQVLDLLIHAADETLATLHAFDTTKLTSSMHDKLASLLHHELYEPSAATKEGGCVVADVCAALDEIDARLIDGIARLACTVGLALRRHGMVHICYIDEFSTETQYSPEFIVQDYTLLCAQQHIPASKCAVRVQAQRLTQTTMAAQLLEFNANAINADFIVVGAIGIKGPQATQLGAVDHSLPSYSHVSTPSGSNALRTLRHSSVPVIVVPPAPSAGIPASPTTPRVFVAAIDNSAMAATCFSTALKLLKPWDVLHVVHIQVPPRRFELDSTDAFATTYAPVYVAKIAHAEIQGRVDVVPHEPGATIAEQIQAYLATTRAAFLVFGLLGDTNMAKRPSDGANGQLLGKVASRLVVSPRCALVICKP
ncbi:Aste57867_22372 [Aphanomyces stellatus]|uniref:Aste57867_22372 protein n=1 Tax=Aphanomyces stellatus TaxID=120398 RepID=A0A485LKS0_9STRA|nr:hypothetical protein As57867_022302 [Aphanomyces stellatus]VFT99035.1 Aste57867_22372 [Aphanomyces stellatus]